MQKQSSISASHQDHHKDEGVSSLAQPQLPFQFYLSNKRIILDEDKFPQPLLTHPETSKSISYASNYGQNTHHSTRECEKILKAQSQLTKLNFILGADKLFENMLLLSPIRSFSSMSSLALELDGSFENSNIPEQILFKSLASFKQLKHLNLSFYCLILDDPELFKYLAKTLRKATKISNLSLTVGNCQNLTSLHFKFLFSSLPKLNHLRSLKLNLMCSRDLFDADLNTLISVLQKLSLLTKIDLNIGDAGERVIQRSTLVKLFKALQSLKNLSNLALSIWVCELLSIESEKPFLESLRCLVGSSIKRLRLDLFLDFSNKNLQKLSTVLKELPLLENLGLSIYGGQDLTDESLAEFGSALVSMTSLISLHLYLLQVIENKNIVQIIARALMSLQNLVSLFLDFRFDNETEDKQFQALFQSFKSIKSLKYLHIEISHQKKITDSSLKVLGESLKGLNLLKDLTLDFRSVPLITNKGVEAICFGIQKGCVNLFSLSLKFDGNSKVNAKALCKIEKIFKSLVSLYSFTLEFGGYLEEADLKELLSVFGQIKNLEEIRLSFPSADEADFEEIDYLKKMRNITVIIFDQ